MKLNFVSDFRIAENASYQVVEHPEFHGFYGVYDTLAGIIVADGYDYDEVIDMACSRNEAWDQFLNDLLG